MSRFNKINVQHFATLVQEIDVSKYTQEEALRLIKERNKYGGN